jgi:magnesium-transporting ATPase (P-type)
MDSKDYLKDISAIKDLMNKSSKFISLSGLSGVFAGIYSLIGAAYYYFNVQQPSNNNLILTKDIVSSITIIILLVGFATTITTFYFTSIRSKTTNEKAWNSASKNLAISFSTSLYIGVLYIAILYFKEEYTYIIALLLLFYGLGLINASKYTTNIVKPLGVIEVIIGLLCIIYPQQSFWFWVVGFGIVHVIYGGLIYYKYDKKEN